MTIAEKLKDLPTAAGIYIHKNAAGKIIYVGKAKNLRSRVRQYFQSSRNLDPKTRNLVKLIADFEFIVVDNEVEALVLESNLIKKHKPRFNVLLKDDKSYPHLKLTNETFPKVVITRRIGRPSLRISSVSTERKVSVSATPGWPSGVRRSCAGVPVQIPSSPSARSGSASFSSAA